MVRGTGPAGLLVLALRVVLGAMFVYAGVVKIADPAGFAQAIANYRILPAGLVHLAAVVLPWVELLAGASMVLGLFLPGGSLVVAGLMLVFACALGFDLWRGLDISCGCFGSTGDAITWWYVPRDLLLSGMAGLVWYFSSNSPLALDSLVKRIRA
jgi:uncharacterized membrane protein YphA (DoxX/SURF4 family)